MRKFKDIIIRGEMYRPKPKPTIQTSYEPLTFNRETIERASHQFTSYLCGLMEPIHYPVFDLKPRYIIVTEMQTQNPEYEVWHDAYLGVCIPAIHASKLRKDEWVFLLGKPGTDYEAFFNKKPVMWRFRNATPLEIMQHRIIMSLND